MDSSLRLFEFLLLVLGLVAMLVRRLHLPYSVGLVLAGIVVSLALFRFYPGVSLDASLVTQVFLPPLVFEAAFSTDWERLRQDMAVVQVLSILGVALSAWVSATGLHLLLGWPWISAGLFGALIAATDPVSVIAAFKEAGVVGRARLLVEAESLFNDGTAAVLFSVLLALFAGTHLGFVAAGRQFLVVLLGSVFCGWVVGSALLSLITKADDHLVEVTFTMTAAYGAYLMAESLQLSGVMATLVAGLVMGRLRVSALISEHGQESITAVLGYTTFISNSFIFLYIGITEAHQQFGSLLGTIGMAILLVLAGRIAAVYPCCLIFAHTRWRVDMRDQHVLFWGGLRGALALALCLELPPALPFRNEITTVCFAVVAFSVFVQGTTMSLLLRRLRIL